MQTFLEQRLFKKKKETENDNNLEEQIHRGKINRKKVFVGFFLDSFVFGIFFSPEVSFQEKSDWVESRKSAKKHYKLDLQTCSNLNQ